MMDNLFSDFFNTMAGYDEAELYRATFTAVENNLANFLHAVKTQPPTEGSAVEFDRARFWENITTAAQKVGE